MMLSLKSRHYEMLRYISAYTQDNGCAPLLREIAEHFSVCIQTVVWYVEALEDGGFIERAHYRRRGISLTQKYWGIAA